MMLHFVINHFFSSILFPLWIFRKVRREILWLVICQQNSLICFTLDASHIKRHEKFKTYDLLIINLCTLHLFTVHMNAHSLCQLQTQIYGFSFSRLLVSWRQFNFPFAFCLMHYFLNGNNFYYCVEMEKSLILFTWTDWIYVFVATVSCLMRFFSQIAVAWGRKGLAHLKRQRHLQE